MANTNVKRVKTSDLELKDRLVAIQRVTKVTKGGRHFRFAAIVVVGDENGVVGYGLGKANEVTAAIAKGVEDAKKNLVKVPVINTTIRSHCGYRQGRGGCKEEPRQGSRHQHHHPSRAGVRIRRRKGIHEARSSRYRCKGRRCNACRVRERRHPERACKEQGLIQPSQPREGYRGRTYRNARRLHCRRSARNSYE